MHVIEHIFFFFAVSLVCMCAQDRDCCVRRLNNRLQEPFSNAGAASCLLERWKGAELPSFSFETTPEGPARLIGRRRGKGREPLLFDEPL